MGVQPRLRLLSSLVGDSGLGPRSFGLTARRERRFHRSLLGGVALCISVPNQAMRSQRDSKAFREGRGRVPPGSSLASLQHCGYRSYQGNEPSFSREFDLVQGTHNTVRYATQEILLCGAVVQVDTGFNLPFFGDRTATEVIIVTRRPKSERGCLLVRLIGLETRLRGVYQWPGSRVGTAVPGGRSKLASHSQRLMGALRMTLWRAPRRSETQS